MSKLGSALWRFFCSLHTSLWLFIPFTVVSVWGSLALQIDGEVWARIDQNIFFPFLLERTLSPLGHKTWWVWTLILILILLAINTLVCTIDRLINLVRRWQRPPLDVSRDFVGNLKVSEQAASPRAGAELLAGAVAALKQRGFGVSTTERDAQTTIIYATKNMYITWLPYLVHIGFLLLLVGHVISSSSGTKSDNNAVLKGSSIPLPNQPGVMLQVDDFAATYYPSGRPKQFSTQLSLWTTDGKPLVASTKVRMNEPLSYQGSFVYLASFGFDQRSSRPYVVLTVNRDPGAKVVMVGALMVTIFTTLIFVLYQRRYWLIVTKEADGSSSYCWGGQADNAAFDLLCEHQALREQWLAV